jgi:hypothetical protein
MDAARSGNDEQAVVGAIEHRSDIGTAADHRRATPVPEWELLEQRRRRYELDDPLDAAIANRVPGALALHAGDHRGFSNSCVATVMSWFLSFTSWRRGTGAASGETLLLGGPRTAGPDA